MHGNSNIKLYSMLAQGLSTEFRACVFCVFMLLKVFCVILRFTTTLLNQWVHLTDLIHTNRFSVLVCSFSCAGFSRTASNLFVESSTDASRNTFCAISKNVKFHKNAGLQINVYILVRNLNNFIYSNRGII